ncbi:MAG: hypothetical protein NWP69_04700 [Congregibacter sp.]|nr:hypothetical protein [Congregibacter sp.]
MFNPQQQFSVSWPAAPAVALAYLDQLERDKKGLTESMQAALRQALSKADSLITTGSRDKKLAREISNLAKDVSKVKLPTAHASRGTQLVATLKGIAQQLDT